jgi:hypothetical protein
MRIAGSDEMKVPAYVAAVCLIVWCGVDIAIKLETARQMQQLVRRTGTPDTSGIEEALGAIAGRLANIEHGLCMLAIPQANIDQCTKLDLLGK